MEESSNHRAVLPLSRLGPRSEIVEVQGGHIVRSTGRKDRHSKVCTAKGPRDRRVRLAAHTAIQFYDVQDRLGYDRPSKAVDWLIKKAKTAIDELAQLPPWHPASQTVNFERDELQKKCEEDQQQQKEELTVHHGKPVIPGASGKKPMIMVGTEDEVHNNPSSQNSGFLPSSLDSDAIADTIKSFFPMGASTEASSSSMQYRSFQASDLLSGSSSNSQDLRLSLQSFQDPILLHHQPSEHSHQQGHSLLGFDGTPNWAEHHQQAVAAAAAAELSRFQRLTAWNSGGGTSNIGNGGAAPGFLFNSQQPALQQLSGHTHFSSQRGPLQSSNSPSIRAWMDASGVAASVSSSDHSQHQQLHHQLLPSYIPMYPSSMQGNGFASGAGGFSGFPILARIHGDVEEHGGYSDKPSSASSDSCH